MRTTQAARLANDDCPATYCASSRRRCSCGRWLALVLAETIDSGWLPWHTLVANVIGSVLLVYLFITLVLGIGSYRLAAR
jgi:fluoride ion exporter CrcB/FEX